MPEWASELQEVVKCKVGMDRCRVRDIYMGWRVMVCRLKIFMGLYSGGSINFNDLDFSSVINHAQMKSNYSES